MKIKVWKLNKEQFQNLFDILKDNIRGTSEELRRDIYENSNDYKQRIKDHFNPKLPDYIDYITNFGIVRFTQKTAPADESSQCGNTG